MRKENLRTAFTAAAIATVFSSAFTVYAVRSQAFAPGAAPVSLAAAGADPGAEAGYYQTAAVRGAAPGNTDFTEAAEKAVNGVVSIKNFASPRMSRSHGGGQASPFSDPFFDFFFGSPRQQQPSPRQRGGADSDESQQVQQGLGSGVIISSDGYIVTNNHVIDGADRLEVTLNDNRSFNAKVVGSDATTDLALLKIDAKDLHVIPMGDSDNLKVGEWVLAVGNPFGFTSTVTSGIVSAKARSIARSTRSRAGGIETYIQTDAAVNPGNSGGALVNLAGELVGINTAIYSNTGSYSGYSFAVPTSLVKKVVSDIRRFGTVQRAILGVTIAELDSDLVKEKNIEGVTEGAYVSAVGDRSSAREAGIREGDVIVDINGSAVRNVAQLQEQVSLYSPGDKITVGYFRDGKRHDVNVTLRNNQGTTELTKATTVTDLGCAFKPLGDDACRELGISQGLQVAGLKDGKFKAAGIKEGFIILDINNARVASADDVERIYNAILKSDDDHVMFITGLYPTGKKVYYAVDLAD